MRDARLAVEVAVAPRAVDFVDGHEHRVGYTVDRVGLGVERAAQRALREAHLELVVGRGHHLGDLVVHEAGGPLGALLLLVARIADDEALHRAFRGQHLRHDARGEVEGGLHQRGVSCLRGTREAGTAG